MKSVVFIAIALVASAVLAEKQPIERYQSIIDRQMFGPLPPDFDPTKSPNEVQKTSGKDERQLSPEQEKLQSSIHFSVINVTPEGVTAVGFTDNSDPKVPRHYYLKEGEERDGWTVKEADAAAATMTIAKGDIEVSLSLGGNSAKDGVTSRAGNTAASAANVDMRRSGFSGGGLFGTLRARRLQRQQEAEAAAAKQQEEQAAKEAERQAQAEHEKEQQEAERAVWHETIQELSEAVKRNSEVRDAAAKAKSEGEGESGANDEAE